jgi:hypothetical protein
MLATESLDEWMLFQIKIQKTEIDIRVGLLGVLIFVLSCASVHGGKSTEILVQIRFKIVILLFV